MKKSISYIFFVIIIFLWGCEVESYQPTPYTLTIPKGTMQMPIPTNNPLTVEGIALGKKLFYDPILSKNNVQSCAGCHGQAFGFTDHGLQYSVGVDGIAGNRNSMTLINVGYSPKFFWDGSSATLEDQVLHPIINPIEMNTTWSEVVIKLKNHSEYPDMFEKAFGDNTIDSIHAAKAMAQFIRTMISGNSKFDKYLRQEVSLTPSELNGLSIYNSEKGDCFHCHGFSGTGQFTDYSFKNNGLDTDAEMTDMGLMAVTGNINDKGKFKTPTLRNIEKTGPYMHDGRFATLEEVINHYDFGGVASSTIDPLMKHVGTGLNLTAQEKQDLLNFLKTLTDDEFLTNPAFSEP
jgi:cytochrome c peroxidase